MKQSFYPARVVRSGTALFVCIAICVTLVPLGAGAQQPTQEQIEAYEQELRDFLQIDDQGGVGVSLAIDQDEVSAHEEVEVRVQSGQTNLNQAQIQWYVNGRLHKGGSGDTRSTIETGAIGETTSVSVSVTTVEGITVERRLSITPAEVDVVWQANTYTPDSYKGKSLPARFSSNTVEFVAFPKFTNETALDDPNNFIFTWRINGDERIGRSGRGENVLRVDREDLRRIARVSVTVSSINGERRARQVVRPTFPNRPEVLIYTHDRYGVDHSRALNFIDEYGGRGNEISLVLEPFFFSVPTRTDPRLEIDWTINGQASSQFRNDPFVQFRLDNGRTAGQASIEVNARNSQNTFEQTVGRASIMLVDERSR